MFVRLLFIIFAPIMKEVYVKDADLQKAAAEGMDEFLKVFYDAIMQSVNGELTAETMAELNSDQVTLVAYQMMHDELMDGGFVQLIHNGLGGFIFLNPFAYALKQWGLTDLSKMIYKVKKLYWNSHEEIEKDCSDEEFMQMFERFPEYDDFDDEFVENEEEWTAMVAAYVDDHITDFAIVQNE